MKKSFLFLLFLFSINFSFTQQDVDNQKDSILQQELFIESKKEYVKFENEHGHFIQTNNVKMHYLTWGKPTATPIIWTHGTFSNGYELFDIADSLVKMGLYVIAIDFYGHGLTPIPEKEVSLYHVADDINYLMTSLKIKKAIIGGWSRGGSISTAFYDAYPGKVLGLILEDGGSVAWDVNGHKRPVDSLAAEFENSYKNRLPPRKFNSELELYKRIYKLHGSKPSFKKTMFSVYSASKPDTLGQYSINPGVSNLVSEKTAEQLLTAVHRPFAANSLFGASTHLLYPKIIYRNLHVPMLIFDPISNNDWFDFETENAKLQQQHPDYITHKVYENTGHNVKEERTGDFLNDIRMFLKNQLKK